MKSMIEGTKKNDNKTDGHGYWMHKDGSSSWGIGIMKGREVPISISKEIHELDSLTELTEKLGCYEELVAEQAKQEKQEKEKEAKKKK